MSLRDLLQEVLPESMGGYPDLFAPPGGWEAWEERAKAALAADAAHGGERASEDARADGHRLVEVEGYRVEVSEIEAQGIGRGFWLCCAALDGSAAHDWRRLQRVKNTICGEEAEGVELYPAESRLADGSNRYHLFVFPGHRFPFGFAERFVSAEAPAGYAQRPFDAPPPDLQPGGARPEHRAKLHRPAAPGEPAAHGGERARCDCCGHPPHDDRDICGHPEPKWYGGKCHCAGSAAPSPETPDAICEHEARGEWCNCALLRDTPESVPFCACGRRLSDCDGSRSGCNKRRYGPAPGRSGGKP